MAEETDITEAEQTTAATAAKTPGGKNDFSKGSIAKTILRLGIPITVAQLVNVLYNIVDRMYIGHLPDGGGTALTALGICLPVTMVVTAFSRLFGDGGSPRFSYERGRGDTEAAARVLGNSFFMLLAGGVLLTVFGIAFLKPILYLFGATELTIGYALTYCRIYLCGSVFVMLALGLNPYINAQGYAKVGMLTVAIGAVMNIALDPLFIYTFGMGVGGAALATVLSQFVSALWVLLFLTGKRAPIRIRLRYMRPVPRVMGIITGMGLAGFVMQLNNSLVSTVINRTLLAVGGELYIGLQTCISSVREVIFMPINGITSASQPILGFNYGAGRPDRVRKTARLMLIFTLSYNLVIYAALQLFPGAFIRLFTDDPGILALGTAPFCVYFACYFMMSFQMAGQTVYVGLGKSKQAIFYSLLRKAFIVVPLTILLPRVGMGVYGVFAAEPISDVLGGAICWLSMYFTVYRKLPKTVPGAEAD